MLDAEERAEPPGPELAADAAGLEAAPGGVGIDHLQRVDPDVAGVDPRRHPLGAHRIAADDGGDQAVVAVVRHLDRLGLGPKAADRQHRPEDLLAPEEAGGRHVGEDAGLHEEAAAVASALAAGERLQPVGTRLVEEAQHLLELRAGGDRPHLGALGEGRADGQRLCPLRQPVEQRRGDRGLDDQPRGRRAHLAGVEEDAAGDAVDRMLEIGVGEDHDRRFPPELQRDRQAARRRRGHHLGADQVRAGERELAQPPVAGQRGAGLGGAGDEVEHAGGQLGLLGDVAVGELDQRRELGGLQHHGAAGGQRGRDLPGAGDQGEVPGHDHADRPDRLEAGLAGEGRRRASARARPGGRRAPRRGRRSSRRWRRRRRRRSRPRPAACRCSASAAARGRPPGAAGLPRCGAGRPPAPPPPAAPRTGRRRSRRPPPPRRRPRRRRRSRRRARRSRGRPRSAGRRRRPAGRRR